MGGINARELSDNNRKKSKKQRVVREVHGILKQKRVARLCVDIREGWRLWDITVLASVDGECSPVSRSVVLL